MPLHARDRDLMPGDWAGDFVIVGRLGDGGMATVYAAVHPLIGKRVAVKVLHGFLCDDEVAVQRFLLEAHAITQIGHPNLVDLYTLGTLPDGRCYYVMEQLDGNTLDAFLGELTIEDSVDVLVQVAQALHAAHQAGFVHRDIKPQNIFVVAGAPRRVRVLDFGIAKLLTPAERGPQTRNGLTLGTPDYVSPEQARGIATHPACDVYSLGVVAFELITGHLPFTADNATDMLLAHLTEEARPASWLRADVPPALDELILAMLCKRAVKRPMMVEVLATLKAVRRPPKPQPRPKPREHAQVQPPPRLARATWLEAAVLVCSLGLGVTGTASRKAPSVSPSPPAAAVARNEPAVPAPSASTPTAPSLAPVVSASLAAYPGPAAKPAAQRRRPAAARDDFHLARPWRRSR